LNDLPLWQRNSENEVRKISLETDCFVRISSAETEPEVGSPDPVKLLAGDPVHTTWNLEDREGLYSGIWQSTPGKWRISYDEWEFCHILSGVSVVSEDGGESRQVGAGDSFILRPGFKGTWEVIETTRKEYVIRL
jgi:uncharacterized protein